MSTSDVRVLHSFPDDAVRNLSCLGFTVSSFQSFISVAWLCALVLDFGFAKPEHKTNATLVGIVGDLTYPALAIARN